MIAACDIITSILKEIVDDVASMLKFVIKLGQLRHAIVMV